MLCVVWVWVQASSPIKSKNHWTPANSDYGGSATDTKLVSDWLCAGSTRRLDIRLLNESLRTDNAHSMSPYLVVARISLGAATASAASAAAATASGGAAPSATATPQPIASAAAATDVKSGGGSGGSGGSGGARYFTVQRLVALNTSYYLQETDSEWKVCADKDLVQWTDDFDFNTIQNQLTALITGS